MNLVKIFKALGDEARLSIVRSLEEKALYAEVLAERLSLSPATVSHHLKKLELAGLIKSRKEQYYKVFSLREEILDQNLMQLIRKKDLSDENQKELQYQKKVIKNFFKNGVLTEIPVQRKKRSIILRHLANEFELGRDYPEKEVNEILGRYHEDFCTLRREFIGEKLMTREKSVYRRVA